MYRIPALKKEETKMEYMVNVAIFEFLFCFVNRTSFM